MVSDLPRIPVSDWSKLLEFVASSDPLIKPIFELLGFLFQQLVVGLLAADCSCILHLSRVLLVEAHLVVTVLIL